MLWLLLHGLLLMVMSGVVRDEVVGREVGVVGEMMTLLDMAGGSVHGPTCIGHWNAERGLQW